MISAIYLKELRSYFSSAVAYIAAFFFLAFTSVWFFYIQRFFAQDVASLRGYFGIMPLVYVLLIPAITMRIWAEERRGGTAETLLTLPFTEFQIVFGKFLAAATLLAVILAATVTVPLSVAPFGEFDAGKTVGDYLGMFLLGAAGIGIGLFISVLSRNQISAFILTALALLVLTLLTQIPASMDLSPRVAAVINYVSLDYHYQGFIKGVIDTRDVVYYLLVVAVSLYASTRVLLFRKWS